MSDMIERVARAIATARAGAENAAVSEFQAGNLWCQAKREARAAIEAMREPTLPMIMAAPDGDCAEVFAAMITAALAPSPTPQHEG